MKKTILSAFALLFILVGCGEDAKENPQTQVAQQETPKKETQKPVETQKPTDGKTLFSKCVSCHGANGEKVALNTSKIIQNMSKEEIINALKGYKDDTYGGKMKSMMKSQVEGLSEENIITIAEYLKK